MKWYNVEGYYSIEINDAGNIRRKPYSLYKGTKLYQRKGRWMRPNKYNKIFIREYGKWEFIDVSILKKGIAIPK